MGLHRYRLLSGFDHKKLINKIQNLKIPLIVFRSKSGGAHVFLFTSDYVSLALMQDKLNEIRSVLGYGGSEVFPKQRELKSKDDTGNFLNLPYFNGDKQQDMLLIKMEMLLI